MGVVEGEGREREELAGRGSGGTALPRPTTGSPGALVSLSIWLQRGYCHIEAARSQGDGVLGQGPELVPPDIPTPSLLNPQPRCSSSALQSPLLRNPNMCSL